MAKALYFIALLLILAACRPSSPPPNPAILPFNESFMDNRNNWGQNDSDLSSRRIENSAMIIRVKSAKRSSWSTTPYIFPSDVAAQADITLPNAPDTSNWDIGIGVRSDGQGNASSFYLCYVNAVGEWGLEARLGTDKWKTIREGKVGSRVDPKKANIVRCAAQGSEITFSFNGKELVRVKDSNLPNDGNPKYVVLYVATYAQANIEAEFRNFQVMKAGK
jgi:hypothetical protein